MKIGIITDKESQIFKEYSLFIDYSQQKYNIYIGYDFTKKQKNISVLSNRIDKTNWWVFSDKEKPTDFNKLFVNVLKEVIGEVIKEYSYKVIDPIINKIDKNELKQFFANKKFDFFLKDGRMIFLYYNKIVIGFDLEVFDWYGWSIKEIIDFKEIKPFVLDDKYSELLGRNKKFLPIFI